MLNVPHLPPTAGLGRPSIRRGFVEPYPLTVRPPSASPSAEPIVDLRHAGSPALGEAGDPWAEALAYVRAFVEDGGPTEAVTIKRFNRRRGADHEELELVLASLDAGYPVAFYGWWPTEGSAATTEILGIDTIEVLPPNRKWIGLVDGHAVVIVGYGRHAAFPGGGYVIVRNAWLTSGWGDEGVGFMPFTYLRAYATELCTYRPGDGPGRRADGHEPSNADRPAAGIPRPPAVAPAGTATPAGPGPQAVIRNEIRRKARCADPNSALTHLFFSDDTLELARAKAICSRCTVRDLCLAWALERRESYGIWGGQLVIEGQIVAEKRGRGRPPRKPRPVLTVDEITGVPSVA